MIHLPHQKLNGIGSNPTRTFSKDPLSDAIDTFFDIYTSIHEDFSQICLISNIFLDLLSDDIQFITKLEIIYGIAYNEFKSTVRELTDAIEMRMIERRYLPVMSSIKRISPESNLIKINMNLLDKNGNFIQRRV